MDKKELLYRVAREKLQKENIKCICNMDKPLLTISNQYPGVWLEHVYDSIMYAKLFDDTSIAINTINAFIDGFVKNYDEYPFSQELDPITGISSGCSTWYSSSMFLYIYAYEKLMNN